MEVAAAYGDSGDRAGLSAGFGGLGGHGGVLGGARGGGLAVATGPRRRPRRIPAGPLAAASGDEGRRKGCILNIASTAGVSPRPNLSWYNASKGWMITATRTMAVELAPYGVRVNAVNPVAGETPLLASFMGEDTPEMRAKFLSTIPIGRFSQPEDIANAALYLCSDEASMVTGVAMEVDGGRCI